MLKPIICFTGLVTLSCSMAMGKGNHKPQSQFEIGLEGIGTISSQANDLLAADEITSGADTQRTTLRPRYYQEPRYRFGGGGYLSIFFKHHYHLKLSYLYLDGKSNIDTFLTTNPLETMSGNGTSSFNAFNVDFGKWMKPSNRWLVNPYIGIGIRKMQQLRVSSVPRSEVVNFITNVGAYGAEFIYFLEKKRQLRGMGPRLGIGTDFQVGGISLVGNLAFTILYGKNKTHFYSEEVTIREPGANASDTFLTIEDEKKIFTPEIDLKLGVKLAKGGQEGNRYSLELGYRVIYLINAFHDIPYADVFFNPHPDNEGQALTYGGPYITLSMRF